MAWVTQQDCSCTVTLLSSLPESLLSLPWESLRTPSHSNHCYEPPKSWGGRGSVPTPSDPSGHWTPSDPGFRGWQGMCPVPSRSSVSCPSLPPSAPPCPLPPARLLPFPATLALMNSFLTSPACLRILSSPESRPLPHPI